MGNQSFSRWLTDLPIMHIFYLLLIPTQQCKWLEHSLAMSLSCRVCPKHLFVIGNLCSEANFGKKFTFQKELFVQHELNLSSRNRWTNQVINKVLEMYLHCLTGDNPKKLLAWLSWVECTYNTSFHSPLKMTPFQPLYKKDHHQLS